MNFVYNDKNSCSGCTDCYNRCPQKAILMVADSDGFKYPTINKQVCNDCGLCSKHCSFVNANALKNTQEPTFYVAKHISSSVLEKSTSGGAFTALSDVVLKENGVIYGADFDKAYNILHKRGTSEKERDAMRVSKYAQSDMADIFKEVRSDLKQGKAVLFTGTPCQTAGLKSYIGTGEISKNLYLCDLICHSIPSPLIWQSYRELLEKEGGKRVSEVYFRSKTTDWSRGNSNRGFVYKLEGEEEYKTDNRFYQLFFGEGWIMRPSCEKCPFTDIHRVSDITIADYWGIEKYSEEWYDKKGVSVIITSTPKGQELLQKAKKGLKLEQRDKSEQVTEQKRLSEPSVFPKTRENSWQEFREKGFEYISDKLKEKYK